jgi:regulator of PEP synthase PpsR (kinase-PPPase family)
VLDAEYFRRIDALNFTMEHDDGQLPADMEQADVVLIGISRTSKTPTSIYLANRGIKTANIPIVLGVPVPDSLVKAEKPLVVGLIATAERISHVRQNRILGTTMAFEAQDYVDRASITEELAYARKICAQAQLADDRRQPPLDRGNGGRDRCPAQQEPLGPKAPNNAAARFVFR